MDYRIEDKYIVTEDYIAYLKSKLDIIMKRDVNMTGDAYLIRSVYFDDMYDSCLDEIEGGINSREKFRIRTYDKNPDTMKLELKRKRNGKTNKLSVAISVEEYNQIIDKTFSIDENSPYLIKKLWAESKSRMLSPVNIVEYERTAYVEPMGNVRITIDRNIGSCKEIDEFFADTMETKPVMLTGQHILEIKYDEFLPDYIRKALNTGVLTRLSYSKYYCSRRGVL